MKPQTLLPLALGLLIGLALNSGLLERRASGQPDSPIAGPVGRFQIETLPAAGGYNPGCYIVDTTTGELWHHEPVQGIHKLADRLPPKREAKGKGN